MASQESRHSAAAAQPLNGSKTTVDPLIGPLLADRYRLSSLLGEGGMGRVYLGEHTLMRKRVAFKVLHKELTQMPEVVARFEREAMAAANIDHPHVAAATDFGKLADGSVFLVLEYVQGKSLRDVINEGPLPVDRAMRIARQMTSALVSAHALGIVHRDLKPENVMLVEKGGEPDFVKVLDFGIAKVPVKDVSERGSIRPAKVITRVGMIFGTPEYMAPEQALGQNVDARADLYALGIVLFEMLSGRRPFSADSPVGILGQQLQGALPTFAKRAPHVHVPVAFEQLVLRLLAPAAASRFQSAEELVLAMDGLLAQLALSTRQPPQRLVLASETLGHASQTGTDWGTSAVDMNSEDVLNASTLPAPEYDFKATTASRDAQAIGRGVRWELAHLPRRRVLRWIMAGALVSVLVVGLWVILRRGTHHPERTIASASVTAEPALAPANSPSDRATDAELEAARNSGLSALLRLTQEHPKDARIWIELARIHLSAGKASESVVAAENAYQIDASASKDAKLATVLWKTAQKRESSEKALNLLAGGFGERGVDILYDLTTTAGVRSDIRRAASAALFSVAAQNAAAPALQALLTLEHADSCEGKLAALPKVGESADMRAMPLLTSMRSVVGCGKRKRSDCYGCMRRGLQLENAIAAVRKRDAAP